MEEGQQDWTSLGRRAVRSEDGCLPEDGAEPPKCPTKIQPTDPLVPTFIQHPWSKCD